MNNKFFIVCNGVDHFDELVRMPFLSLDTYQRKKIS